MTAIRTIASGVGRCEGPLLTRAGALLIVSMSDGFVYELADSGVRTHATTYGGPNGLAEGADGRLYVAQMGTRVHAKRDHVVTGGVQVVDAGGEVSWLTQDPIAPNDLCFGPDGLLYLTDPTRQPARDDGRLWRCNVETGEVTLLASVGWFPNGIGFGVEDDALYVASTSGGTIERFPLTSTGLGRPERFVTLPHGVPDGFAFDRDGNLIVAAIALAEFGSEPEIGELQTFDRDGRLLDRLRIGDSRLYTNLALTDDGTAFVTDTEGGEVIEVAGHFRPGLALHPFRG